MMQRCWWQAGAMSTADADSTAGAAATSGTAATDSTAATAGEVSVLKVRLEHERDVVQARQRAREIAEMLGFDRQDQVRLATATSELARNAFRYAREGVVEFAVAGLEFGAPPQSLVIRVQDAGPGFTNAEEVLSGRYRSTTGMGMGLVGTRRLMDDFALHTGAGGTTVTVRKAVPRTPVPLRPDKLRRLAATLTRNDTDPLREVERQNQELMRTLAELREKQEQLAQVNSELEDTNRGVVALYAELEQNAADLRRVSDLKTSFLSNLSHEFRTPLNSILALCQILSDHADGDLTAEQEKQVGYIRRSAADLSEMVNDLLDLAKVEAGKTDIRPRQFSVADLFAALRGMLRNVLHTSSVELLFTAPDDLPAMFTDEQKVSQILRNLISNALKFTERGQVHVSACLEGMGIVFRVADTGIGIAAEDWERVFEEFVQIGGEIQSRVRGTGLGLPLSRNLATLLGGSLDVESSSPAGSTFRAEIPARYVDVADAPAVMAPEMQEDSRPRLLVVEDNQETRYIHQAALQGENLSLQFARNLNEAREVVGRGMPAALLLDRHLEGADGLSFIEELRSTGFTGPVVVTSVNPDSVMPLQAGADAFLAKPIEPGVLVETLARLMASPAQAAALLVDDDEINRYVLREALLPLGFRVVEARGGREALALLRSHTFAVIVLDQSMPGMTGTETLRELRAGGVQPAIPAILHTSKELSEAELQAIHEAGAVLFPKQALAAKDASYQLRAALRQVGAG